jgi:flavin-dependent dehydrogenase
VAHFLSFLFAKRGFRTLMLARHKEIKAGLIFLDRDVAAKLKPVAPPEECVLHKQVSIELWAPDEKHVVRVRDLPFLAADEAAYCRFLELHGNATRNLRILRGFPPAAVVQESRGICGVVVEGGTQINGRLIVECDCADSMLAHGLGTALPFPRHAPYMGVLHAHRRRVGTAASAWRIGQLSLRVLAGKLTSCAFRSAQEEIDLVAWSGPGQTGKPDRWLEKAFVELGLEHVERLGEKSFRPYLGPPFPVFCASGFVATGAAAGHCSSFWPLDVTPSVASAQLAFVAASRALEEGAASAGALWDYTRGFATDWGRNLASTYCLSTMLRRVGEGALSGILASGVLDTYVLACLFRSQLVREEALDALVRHTKALTRPSSAFTWMRALKRARTLAAAYGEVPSEYNESAVARWSSRLMGMWDPVGAP